MIILLTVVFKISIITHVEVAFRLSLYKSYRNSLFTESKKHTVKENHEMVTAKTPDINIPNPEDSFDTIQRYQQQPQQHHLTLRNRAPFAVPRSHHKCTRTPCIWFLTDASLYECYDPPTEEDDIKEKRYGFIDARDVTKFYFNEERRGQHEGRASLRRHHMAGRLSPLDLCAPATLDMFSSIKENYLPLGFLDSCSFSRFQDCIHMSGSVEGYDSPPPYKTTSKS
mgnify:CR=1